MGKMPYRMFQSSKKMKLVQLPHNQGSRIPKPAHSNHTFPSYKQVSSTYYTTLLLPSEKTVKVFQILNKTKQEQRPTVLSAPKLSVSVGSHSTFKIFIFNINPFLSSVLKRRRNVQKQMSSVPYNTPKYTHLHSLNLTHCHYTELL